MARKQNWTPLLLVGMVVAGLYFVFAKNTQAASRAVQTWLQRITGITSLTGWNMAYSELQVERYAGKITLAEFGVIYKALEDRREYVG